MNHVNKFVGALFVVVSALVVMWSIHHFSFKGEPPRAGLAQHAEVLSNDFYSSQVQPIFSARCVACHSCYNSPCQLNLTSYSGVVRGATKVDPYDFPLVDARPPTRLDVDAKTEAGWHAKGFFSVLSNTTVARASRGDSTLWELLALKHAGDSTKNIYNSEVSRSCPIHGKEFAKFASAQAFAGMPYGLPALSPDQRETLGKWLDQGAPGPSNEATKFLKTPQSRIATLEIGKWEALLNQTHFASRLAARYFYEHLFIGHLNFDPVSHEFFRIVRARNEHGEPDEIATVRPFDDPGPKFFYRFQKIDGAIVAKTHTVFNMSEQVRKSFEKEFFEGEWRERVTKLPPYGNQAANAFVTFQAIPRQARYRFLLENGRYFIMNFIKGPVCRGQTALNVINEHFWVMFLDPKFDLTAQGSDRLKPIEALLDPPASIANQMEVFSDIRERRWKANVLKNQLYAKDKVGFDEKAIWNGEGHDRNALLTVYRHFDSADVRWGAEGQNPKTVWVMDYQIFEDIYYNLVAGYNLYGTLLHQVDTRLYMDLSRIASEDMFINFLPKDQRIRTRKSWSTDAKATLKAKIATDIFGLFGASAAKEMGKDYQYPGLGIDTAISFATDNPKGELLEKLFADRFVSQVREKPDLINLPAADRVRAEPPPETSGVISELRKIAGQSSIFAVPFPDISLMRVRMKRGPDQVFSLVHNKAHANVNLLFLESLRREPLKDSVDIVPGFAASYPNFYFDLKEDDVADFVKGVQALAKKPLTDDEIQKIEASEVQMSPRFASLAKKFGVSRFNKDFWRAHDWFNSKFAELEPVEAGLLDLNRYENF